MHRSICDFVLDLVQNSIEAGSSLVIVDFRQSHRTVEIFVSDNGPGMSPEKLARVKDPFFTDGTKHLHRDTGLGLPFLAQSIELSGGYFDIDSREGQGTSVKVRFDLEHIDTPPMGNLSHTLLAALTYPGEYEMVINRSSASGSYSLTRSEIGEALGGFETAGALKLLRAYLISQERSGEEATVSRENEEKLRGGGGRYDS